MRLPNWFARILAGSLDGLVLTEYAGDNPLWGGSPVGGVAVDKDSALQLAAFWGCVRYVSSAVAMTPWGPYRVTPAGGREEMRKHRLWATLHESFSPGVNACTGKEALMWQALVGGNGLAEIVGDRLVLMDASRVTYRAVGMELVYEYRDAASNETRRLLPQQVFHLRGPSRDGLVGLSVISAARETIGLGLATQTYGSAYYGAGTHVGGVYEHPGTLTPEQIKELRDRIDEDKGARRAHRPRILTGGMTYKADTIPPQDAQFLETRKFSAREIASLFGVPPHKIGIEEGATAYASREQAAIEAVVDCLMPWIVRLEQEANNKLLTPKERAQGLYTKLSLDVHLRGDAKSRAEFYREMVRSGAMRPNEVRAKEDLDADPDGDELFIPRDLIPMSKSGPHADSEIEKNTQSQPNALAPLVDDALVAIRKRAAYDKSRGRAEERTVEFARMKLDPLKKAHEVAGLTFDAEALIKKGMEG